jgi:hypothetical protein
VLSSCPTSLLSDWGLAPYSEILGAIPSNQFFPIRDNGEDKSHQAVGSLEAGLQRSLSLDFFPKVAKGTRRLVLVP